MMDLRFDCDVPPTVHHGDTVLHLDDGEATGPLFLTQNTDFRCREVCKLGDLTAFELRAVLILEQMSVLIEVQAARFKDRERQHQPSSFKYGGWVAECHDMVDAKKKKKDEKMESIRRDVEAFLDGIEGPPPPAVEPITSKCLLASDYRGCLTALWLVGLLASLFLSCLHQGGTVNASLVGGST